MSGPVAANAKMRMERLSLPPGGPSTWQVVGHPFRVVAVGAAWRVVAVGDEGQRLLAHHDLVGRAFPTRVAAIEALSAVVSSEAPRSLPGGQASSMRR
jgi:hypothetical protein